MISSRAFREGLFPGGGRSVLGRLVWAVGFGHDGHLVKSSSFGFRDADYTGHEDSRVSGFTLLILTDSKKKSINSGSLTYLATQLRVWSCRGETLLGGTPRSTSPGNSGDTGMSSCSSVLPPARTGAGFLLVCPRFGGACSRLDRSCTCSCRNMLSSGRAPEKDVILAARPRSAWESFGRFFFSGTAGTDVPARTTRAVSARSPEPAAGAVQSIGEAFQGRGVVFLDGWAVGAGFLGGWATGAAFLVCWVGAVLLDGCPARAGVLVCWVGAVLLDDCPTAGVLPAWAAYCSRLSWRSAKASAYHWRMRAMRSSVPWYVRLPARNCSS